MFSYALKSLRANLTRLIATSLAIILGIGFLASGLMLTDAVRAGLTGNVEQQYKNVDLAVVSASDSGGGEFGQGIQAEVLDLVEATPGVAAAAGELQANVRVLRPDGTTANLRSFGRAWIEDDKLNPLSLAEGHAPESKNQIVVDRDLAKEADAKVGSKVKVETPSGTLDMTIVGISRFGDQNAIDDGGTVSFAADAATSILNTGTPGFTDVIIRTSGDPEAVRQELERKLPGTVEVQTSSQFIETASESALAFISFLRPILQGFAYLAMFVSAFVIFNTFSVVVTQRFRELALIRAIGGTPAQVRRSLMVEGLGIGVSASAIGIVFGAGLAKGLQAILGKFNLALPGAGVKITIGTILLCMFVGTVVTLLAVIIPAFRAGRTKPVEAMRSSAVDTSGTSKVRAAFGGSFLVISITLLLINRFNGVKWYLLAPGALLLFLGLFIGGPLLARVFGKMLRVPMSAFGLVGRIASDNVVRNPKRTATTANALVIGLFLVTLVTVSGEAMKTSVVEELNKLSSSDFIVMSQGAIAPELVKKISDVNGISDIAPVRSALAIGGSGETVFISSADFDELANTAGLKVTSGSAESVIAGEGIAVPDFAELGGGGGGGGGQGTERLGDLVTFKTVGGEDLTLPVTALLEAKLDSLFLGYVVSPATFTKISGEKPVNQIFIRVEPGEANAVGQRLERTLQGYTGVEVQPGNFIGQIVGKVFDFLIGAVNALLAMSVIVALVGIVNTMTLSIFERRKELGLVRALGMTRTQVGRMVRLEAVLMGLLGTVIGMSAGILLSWVVISSIADGAIDLSFNWARVGLIFLTGIAVGVIAALLPARRATRLNMLDAINDS
ncbi:MAG TPA: FtsX-like permease family protein [Microthrixaceae bacterium]|nr:FtsX-like permease family protein [Microthrixaceae bacterium]